MDFNENTLDSDDCYSDGNDDGGDGDFAIYDFNKDVMICPSKARHVHHEGPINGALLESSPPNKVFSVTILLLR